MLLDIGIGILAALIFTASRDVALTGYVLGTHVLFALLPDADFLLQWVRRKNFSALDASHRNLFHNPLIYVPVGAIVMSIWAGRLAWSFALVSILHFLHDSVGIGWGVRWLYPFSRKSYKFFCEHDGSLSWNFMTSWRPEEQEALEERWNSNKDWFRQIYLKPHPINIIEMAGFILAAAALIYYFRLQLL